MDSNTILNSKAKCQKCRDDKKKCVVSEDVNETRCTRCVEKGNWTCVRDFKRRDDGPAQNQTSPTSRSPYNNQETRTMNQHTSLSFGSPPSILPQGSSVIMTHAHPLRDNYNASRPDQYANNYRRQITPQMNNSRLPFISPGTNDTNHLSQYNDYEMVSYLVQDSFDRLVPQQSARNRDHRRPRSTMSYRQFQG